MKVSKLRRQPRPRARRAGGFFHVTWAKKRPELPDVGQGKACKRFKWCPGPDGWKVDFGLAGGGYGVYSHCPKRKCQRITEKTESPEDM